MFRKTEYFNECGATLNKDKSGFQIYCSCIYYAKYKKAGGHPMKNNNNSHQASSLPEQNEQFYLITGYSEGGFIHGITWEEAYIEGLAECGYLCDQQMM
ncbi:hypothetical protein SAMN04244570_0121 [Sporosarcina newyorkensis]|uniref:Uncharacterized protein n=2 Tax=Caryophanaceae TaxID=186818 RepID=A0A1T4YWF7_9BACL|nr:hypothetical protein SAMN04244570_0121 [Sporosarcina newyorkensis]